MNNSPVIPFNDTADVMRSALAHVRAKLVPLNHIKPIKLSSCGTEHVMREALKLARKQLQNYKGLGK